MSTFLAEFIEGYHQWRNNQFDINEQVGIDLKMKKLRGENSLTVAKKYYELCNCENSDLSSEDKDLLKLLETQRGLGRKLMSQGRQITEKDYMNEQGISEMCNVMIQTAPLDAINGLQNLSSEDRQQVDFSKEFDFEAIFFVLYKVKDQNPIKIIKNYYITKDDEEARFPYPETEMNALIDQLTRSGNILEKLEFFNSRTTSDSPTPPS